MADQWAAVTFTTPASSGNLDITSPSITETFNCAILIYTKETTDDSNRTHGVLGIGFVSTEAGDSAANHTTSCIGLEDGVVSADNNTDHSLAHAIRANDGTGVATFPIQATYDSAISGGVRLAFTVSGGVQAKCTAILFAGLTRSAVGNATFTDAAASLENVGNSVVGYFEPDLVVFSSSDNALSTAHANGRLALGFATNTSPIQQVAAYINCDDAADPTDADGYIRSDCCSAGFVGAIRTGMDRFRVTSFAADGFNAIAEDTGDLNSPQANYLALKFSDSTLNLAAKNVAVTGSAGSQSTTAIGFQPSLVFGMSTLLGSVDTLTDGSTASSGGYFAFTSTYERAYSVSAQEGLNTNPATTVARTRQGDHAVLTLTHDASVAQQASLTSMDSQGFTLDFTTATAGYLTLMAIGAGASAVVTSETEQISDSVVAFLNQTLVLSETVQISDAVVLDTMDVSATEGPQGWTYEARAERGTALTGGAEAGTVL